MTTRKRHPASSQKPPATDTAADAEAQSQDPTPVPFPIVGIGASAGGLSAIEEFLEALPPADDVGMAFVLVQHLDPDHKSLLLDLVRRYTTMKVSWAEDGAEVVPGAAYVMPPNKDIAIVNGHLVVGEPEAPRGRRLPIDSFFRSLALDRREQAVCIVLSGTGSDGVLGLRAVKGEGGMAMAQLPETAAYDGMPRSAINTGLVDYTLAPKDMASQLVPYVRRVLAPGVVTPEAVSPTDEQSIRHILLTLRTQTGHDFSQYKRNTIGRRIERRMVVQQIDRVADYASLVAAEALERETLFRELLIGVTNFFRDPQAFAALADEAIPRIIASASQAAPVRVWVPACSTGEEAYSIAILLQERSDDEKRNIPVSVFATDIDAVAIEKARAGIYPASIAADVTPERLARYFVQEGETYRVRKTIRDAVVFAEQNVIKDPPFAHLHLVSCRNLLIYMGTELQKRLVPLFHYSLNEGGFLFLGTSESIGGAVDLFAPVDKKWKLYVRKNAVAVRPAGITAFAPRAQAARLAEPPRPPAARESVRERTERTLLERHSPPCVMINADADILFIHGHVGRFLEPPPGEATGNLLRMAREGLKLEIASGLRKCIAHDEPVGYAGLHVKTNGDTALVDVTIEPAGSDESTRGVYLVVFEEAPQAVASDVAESGPAAVREQRIADLERELTAKEEYLQTAVEELETSNEELKSANEELQSANEELQSTNEELETSKEELQSVNEELVTVNNELQLKLEELSRAHNDMSNLLAGTGIATIFVDHNMRIQRFTPAATQISNLIGTDVGRPIGDIASRLRDGPDIIADISAVLDTLVPIDEEVETSEGDAYLMRIQPYRTLENVIEGVVLTFVDVKDRRQLERELQEQEAATEAALRAFEAAVGSLSEPLIVLDESLAVVAASSAFAEAFGEPAEALVGQSLFGISGGGWDVAEVRRLVAPPAASRLETAEFTFTSTFGRLGARTVSVSSRQFARTEEKQRLISLVVTAIS